MLRLRIEDLPERVERLLRLAWATELMMLSGLSMPRMLRRASLLVIYDDSRVRVEVLGTGNIGGCSQSSRAKSSLAGVTAMMKSHRSSPGCRV